MAAPTFVQEAETAWDSATSPKTTGSFGVQAGDVLIGVSGAENDLNTPPTLSGGSLTWTTEATEAGAGGGNSSQCRAFSAIVDSNKSMTGSFSAAGSRFFGGNIFTFRGSDGVGAAVSTNNGTGSGAPSLNITTTQDNSAIVVIVVDWNALTSSRTWRTVNSIAPSAGNGFERTYFANGANYTVYAAYYPDAGVAGSKTVGLSAPSGQRYVIAAVEVLGAAGGGGGAVAGSLDETLAALTVSGAGQLGLAAALDGALAALTSSSAGQLDLAAAVSQALASASLSASGQLDLTAALSTSLDALALSSLGSSGATGSVLAELAGVTLSGAGELDIAAALANTLGELSVAAIATVDLVAALNGTLDELGASASAKLLLAASLSETLAGLAVDSLGSHAGGRIGSLASSLASITVSAAGELEIDGELAGALAGLALSAAGELALEGSLAETLEALGVSAFGGAARHAEIVLRARGGRKLILRASGSKGQIVLRPIQ